MKKARVRSVLLVLLDIFLAGLAVYLAYGLRFDFAYNTIAQNHWVVIPQLLLLSILVKLPCYYGFNLYNSIWKYAGTYELLLIFLAVGLGNLLVTAASLMLQWAVPRSIFLITAMLDVGFLVLVRFAYRLLRRFRLGIGLKHQTGKRVLVIGAGEAGAGIIKEMQLHPQLGLVPVAAVDDNAAKVGQRLYGVPVLGGRRKLPKVIQQQAIEEVIIAIPQLEHKDFSEIYDLCTEAGCKVRALPSVSQLIDESVLIQQVRDVSIEDLLGREPIVLDLAEITEFLQHRTVLITGAGGSIGSELARQLAFYAPDHLVLLDNYENSLFAIEQELKRHYPNQRLTAIVANIRDEQRLNSVFKQLRPAVIFHAAAHKHVPLMEENPGEAVKNNILGTLNVGRAAIQAKVKRFVLISTDKAVNPTNIMGASKRVAEMIIQSLNQEGVTQFAAVRFGNVLGSNGSVIPTFQKQIAEGGPVTVTHKEITRFFMTIPEAVQLVIQAGIMAAGGEIFVLDMGKPVKIYDLAKRMIRLSGFEPDQEIPIEIVGLRPGEKLYEELLLDAEGLAATKNDKIFILQPCAMDQNQLWREVAELEALADGRAGAIRKQMRKLVPTLHREEGA